MNKTGCLSLRRRSLLQAAALAGLFSVTAEHMKALAAMIRCSPGTMD